MAAPLSRLALSVGLLAFLATGCSRRSTSTDLGGSGGTDAGVDAAFDGSPSGDGAAGDGAVPCTSEFTYLHDGLLYKKGAPYFLRSLNYGIDLRVKTVGGQQKVFLAPHHSYCVDNLCCGDEATCLDELKNQLAHMKTLGANSIRLVGLAVRPDNFTGTGLRYTCLENPAPGQIWACPSGLHTDAPHAVVLELIEQAVTLVGDAGLDIVLLAGHGAIDGPTVRDAYRDYLSLLAARLKANPHIIAYDLMNEPVYEADQKGIAKAEAGQIVRAWYDAIRNQTSRQMVTLGVADSGSVWSWDPGAMPLDFASYHLYTGTPFTSASLDKLALEYSWIGAASRPALIGETGLTTPEQGSESEQLVFAQFSLDHGYDCNTMGVQWWWYRDVHWGGFDHFGLTRYDGSSKPAAGAWQSFDPTRPKAACERRASYYNLEGHAGHVTRGRLIRSDGSPVAEGLVRGRGCPDTARKFNTFSRADGTFEIASDVPLFGVEATATGLDSNSTYSLCVSGDADVGDITLPELPTNRSVWPPTTCVP